MPSPPSAWPNYVWIFSSAIVAIGGLAYVNGTNSALTRITQSLQPSSPHISEDKLSKINLVLPFFIIPLVSAILAHQLVHSSAPATRSFMYTLTLYVCLFLIAAVLFRQLAAIFENSRLHSSLNHLSKSLEERVELRTKELATERDKLAILNRAAAKISHSTSSNAVINGVLDLIMEATRSDGAAIHSPTGTLRFLGSRTANRVARAQLARATKLAYGADETSEVGLAVAQNGVIVRVWDESEEYGMTACLPLISRGERVASLCLGRRDLDFSDSHDYLDLAQSLASQVAVALDNARRYEDAHYLAERDPVTGLLNHRGMNKRLQQELARCARTGSQCAVVMMDVDNFKIFNDTWGHPVGDSVLMAISQLLTTGARKCDIAARYGGDEFLMLLADADSDKALNLVRRVQESISNFAFTAPDGCQIPIVLSYGIASYPNEGQDLSKLLIAADDNLYLSKSKGGDCITSGETEVPIAPSSSGTFSALDGLVTTVDNKDHYTRRHSDNVCTWAVALAKQLGFTGKDLDSILIAGLLHDVGKIAIPDRLLKKPGKLTDDEFETVKQHVSFGELVINDLPNIAEIMQAVSTHHERWDGKGYPRGMKREQIPLAGRIMVVADAYSAMTTDRPYRKALTSTQARKELRSVAGSQLDPKVVKMFLKLDEIDIRSVDDEFPTLLAG
jgi:diguanylate cyclase (GGDEF)-like protein